MNKNTKTLIKVLTPFAIGCTAILAGTIITVVGTVQSGECLKQIDSFYNTAVYETIEQDLNRLQYLYEHNEISKAYYENEVQNLKRDAIKEYCKNDEAFAAIVKKDENLEPFITTGLCLIGGGLISTVVSGIIAEDIERNEIGSSMLKPAIDRPIENEQEIKPNV